jgi:hypothetical protein
MQGKNLRDANYLWVILGGIVLLVPSTAISGVQIPHFGRGRWEALSFGVAGTLGQTSRRRHVPARTGRPSAPLTRTRRARVVGTELLAFRRRRRSRSKPLGLPAPRFGGERAADAPEAWQRTRRRSDEFTAGRRLSEDWCLASSGRSRWPSRGAAAPDPSRFGPLASPLQDLEASGQRTRLNRGSAPGGGATSS